MCHDQKCKLRTPQSVEDTGTTLQEISAESSQGGAEISIFRSRIQNRLQPEFSRWLTCPNTATNLTASTGGHVSHSLQQALLTWEKHDRVSIYESKRLQRPRPAVIPHRILCPAMWRILAPNAMWHQMRQERIQVLHDCFTERKTQQEQHVENTRSVSFQSSAC